MRDEELRELERRARAGDRIARDQLARARERAGLRRFAVIACVHGNLEALRAVLDDIDRRAIDDVICLGDVVGLGPDPVACLDLVRARCRVVLQGEFEERVLHAREHERLTAIDQNVAATREALRAGERGAERWAFLESLAVRHDAGPDAFVHGRDLPSSRIVAELTPEMLALAFADFGRLLFIAHTHGPCVVTDELASETPSDDASWTYPGRGKAIVNVGAVGHMPYLIDVRACYVVVSGDTIAWRFVHYDVQSTIAKLHARGDWTQLQIAYGR